MGQRIKLKAISPSIDATGVFGPQGEYPVGTILMLPDNVPFVGSGYERHELLDAEKTEEHEPAVTDPVIVEDPDVEPGAKTYSAAATDSPGWWVITDQDGNEVGKKVRPADGAAFNDLDDAGKAKFIAEQEA